MSPAWTMLAVALVAAPLKDHEVRGTVEIRFSATSTLHDFEGVAPPVGWVATRDDGEASWNATVSLPVSTIDTGNAFRDRNMRNMLEAESHPTIDANVHGIRVERLRHPGVNRPLEFDLTIRNVTRRIRAPLESRRDNDDGTVTFDLSFEVSLPDFGLEPPSVLFIEVGEIVAVHVRVNGVPDEGTNTAVAEPGEGIAILEDLSK